MNKKTLQIRNYPEKEIEKLTLACVKRKCNYVEIVVPAINEFLAKKKN